MCILFLSKKIKTAVFWLGAFFYSITAFPQEYSVISPDQKIKASVQVGSGISFKLYFSDKELFTGEKLALDIDGAGILGQDPQIKDITITNMHRNVIPEVREKVDTIPEQFQELRIDFQQNFSLVFRAYNNGFAYRFLTHYDQEIIVKKETLQLLFDEDDQAIYQKEDNFVSSYETPYIEGPLSEIEKDQLCLLPYLVAKKNGPKLLITESDLVDYPGMWLVGSATSALHSTFPAYPLELAYAGSIYSHGKVKKTADHIAKTKGERSFPWRIFAVAEKDGDLLSNQLVYLLASPSKLNDVSWIEPGVITFDWWGRRNIYNVDFKAGINTETAKYFIDFASDFGIEYFLFDDGWTSNENLFDIHPDLDMKEVIAYAHEKKVKIMLWLIWSTFAKQMEEALDLYEQWGIAGLKIDFMNRDDQQMVNFYHKVARETAKRKMVVDFHGAYKPAGLRRNYPNILTREGLVEFEYNGWTSYPTPDHHNVLPYIRMVTGSMDYIPCTMNNATKGNFRPVGDRPMGQGTRAHAIALFIVLESPMQMLPDSPSDYYRERTCMDFIAKLPVEWDELKVLEAKIGDYTVLARRNGSDWYLAAITDWDQREFDISFDFLGEGKFEMEYIQDGINADTRAIDYEKYIEIISRTHKKKIRLASGGGWVARITPVNN